MDSDVLILPELFATPWRFLWHAPSRTAVLSDLHLGAAETLTRQGISMPDTALPQLARRWHAMLARQPARIIIAGDLFDSPEPSNRALALCRDLLAAAACPVAIIPGNHDPKKDTLSTLLGPTHEIARHATLPGILISHGHDMTHGEAAAHGDPTWIVGHQHPAITLATRVQQAKMPCFALCRSAEDGPPSHVIILPAFSSAPLGCNLLSPLQWLLPIKRPSDEQITLFGLVEGANRVPQVLPFGPLSMHA